MIQQELALKVPKAEIESFTKETNEMVKNFAKEMGKLKLSVECFERVLERFDEIILDKAGKDETKKLNEKVAELATTESVKLLKNQMVAFTKENEAKFLSQCALVDKMKGNFDYILEKFEALKKEIFDVSNLSATVLEFKEAVERKADKQDIFEIYDNMCKRTEFVEANDNLNLLKRQVEQGIALMFSLCRTLLKNGEPSSQIKKQRYDLLKNLNSLVNWISGDSLNSFVLVQSPRNVDLEDNDGMNDSRHPSRQSAFLRRRSAATAKVSTRHHLNFPKLG